MAAACIMTTPAGRPVDEGLDTTSRAATDGALASLVLKGGLPDPHLPNNGDANGVNGVGVKRRRCGQHLTPHPHPYRRP